VVTAAPTSADDSAPHISITPTSGPIGTMITATITDCLPGDRGSEARVDFAFVGQTPANSVFFVPREDGRATVQIEALDKPGPGRTDQAEVNVSQCGNQGWASAPFTVTSSVTGFRDVPPNHPHAEGIEWLVAEGITRGCSPDRYCPGDAVNRAQMGTFLQRALDLPPGGVSQFRDVPSDHPHADGIGAIAQAAITQGCTSDRYCPADDVNRGQMATFLMRALRD
jgi:hypothetical protein